MSSIEAANLFNVNGLVAVVTGGGSGRSPAMQNPSCNYDEPLLTFLNAGIGFMIAKALALNGAHKVYIIGRRKENLETAAKESPYNNIVPIQGDVTSKESLSSIVAHIQQEIGYINVLIANSGIGGPQEGSSATRPDLSLEEFQSKLWSTSFEDYTQTFAVNASSVFFSIVAFLGLLHAGNEKGNVVQKSQVIVTSSIGGYNRNVPGGYAYGQSKAAATHLVKQMATNLVPYEIRANALAPGRTITFHFSSSQDPLPRSGPFVFLYSAAMADQIRSLSIGHVSRNYRRCNYLFSRQDTSWQSRV